WSPAPGDIFVRPIAKPCERFGPAVVDGLRTLCAKPGRHRSNVSAATPPPHKRDTNPANSARRVPPAPREFPFPGTSPNKPWNQQRRNRVAFHPNRIERIGCPLFRPWPWAVRVPLERKAFGTGMGEFSRENVRECRHRDQIAHH